MGEDKSCFSKILYVAYSHASKRLELSLMIWSYPALPSVREGLEVFCVCIWKQLSSSENSAYGKVVCFSMNPFEPSKSSVSFGKTW